MTVPPDPLALLVNPSSGGGRGAHVGARALTALRAGGHDVQVVTGRDAGEAAGLLSEAVAAGVSAVVVAGGDGTVQLAVNALGDSAVPLGVIPAGTGNDLARYLGLPLRDPEAAAAVVTAGVVRPIGVTGIDITGIGERRCVGVVAAGVDAVIAARTVATRWPRGRSRYAVATVAELLRVRPRRYRIDLDDATLEVDAVLVAAGSLPTYGGGMALLPTATPLQDHLQIIVVDVTGRLELLRVFPSVYRGRHLGHRSVSLHRSTQVRIEIEDDDGLTAYADGEPVGTLPLTLRSLPRALRVLVPAAG